MGQGSTWTSHKTQLQQQRLVLPDGAQPVAIKRDNHHPADYFLYRQEDAVPVKRRAPQPKDYASQFARRYPSRRSAYVDACQALFELNRYAKHDTCSPKHQDAIYRLKDAWIKKLYQEGFCTEAFPLITAELELECRRCEGSGEDEDGYRCKKCSGTGIYRVPGGAYWAFRFLVDAEDFAWHQPMPLPFVAQPLGTSRPHEVLGEERPVSLAANKFAQAKALIAWCLEEDSEMNQDTAKE